jgi:hypothetical protein
MQVFTFIEASKTWKKTYVESVMWYHNFSHVNYSFNSDTPTDPNVRQKLDLIRPNREFVDYDYFVKILLLGDTRCGTEITL